MSYQDFERAMALAPSCEYFTTAGGRTLEQIQKRKKNARYKLSPQLLEFYKSLDIYPSLAMKYLGSILIAPPASWKAIRSLTPCMSARIMDSQRNGSRSTTMMTAI